MPSSRVFHSGGLNQRPEFSAGWTYSKPICLPPNFFACSRTSRSSKLTIRMHHAAFRQKFAFSTCHALHAAKPLQVCRMDIVDATNIGSAMRARREISQEHSCPFQAPQIHDRMQAVTAKGASPLDCLKFPWVFSTGSPRFELFRWLEQRWQRPSL